MSLAEEILKDGVFIVSDACHYQIYAETGEIIFDEHIPTDVHIAKPPLVDLKQPSWPGKLSAFQYKDNVRRMLAGEWVHQNHIIISEIVRAIDCRLAEILFDMGLYDERSWVIPSRQLGVSKKIRICCDILPRAILPKTLIREITELRNRVEHRYEDSEKGDVHRASEIMEGFLRITDKVADIFSETSCFRYKIKNEAVAVIQILREEERLLLCMDGQYPSEGGYFSTRDKMAKALLKKISHDLLNHLDGDVGFMSKMGFV